MSSKFPKCLDLRLREEIAELESTLNEMHELKKQACALVSNVEENVNKLALIEKAINRLNQDLSLLRDKQSSEIKFKARAKWYDQGEKSNKYPFLVDKFTDFKFIRYYRRNLLGSSANFISGDNSKCYNWNYFFFFA